MEGIQINNFYSNQITVHGKRFTQKPTQIIQTFKPKPHVGHFFSGRKRLDDPNDPNQASKSLKRLGEHYLKTTSLPRERGRSNYAERLNQNNKPPQTKIQPLHERGRSQTNREEHSHNNREDRLVKGPPQNFIMSPPPRQERDSDSQPSSSQRKGQINSQAKKIRRQRKGEQFQGLSKRSKSAIIKPVTIRNHFAPIIEISTTTKKKKTLTSGKAKPKQKKKNTLIHINTIQVPTSAQRLPNRIKFPISSKQTATNSGKSSRPASARDHRSSKKRLISKTTLPNTQSKQLPAESALRTLHNLVVKLGHFPQLAEERKIVNNALKKMSAKKTLDEDHSQLPKHRRLQISEDNSSSEAAYNLPNQKSKEDRVNHSENEQGAVPYSPPVVDQIINRSLFANQAVSNWIQQTDSFEDSQQFNEAHQEARKRQIEQLKLFQKQYADINAKIVKQKAESQQPHKIQKRTLSIEVNLRQSIPPRQQLFKDDPYPFHALQSPKASQLDIESLISAKQKYLTAKHSKLNELVQGIYNKQMVSPKSFELQQHRLKAKFQEETKSLEKETEQIQKLLADIKKDKNQLKGIEQLIRTQNWEAALNFVNSTTQNAAAVNTEESKELTPSPSLTESVQLDDNNSWVQIHPKREELPQSRQETLPKPPLSDQDEEVYIEYIGDPEDESQEKEESNFLTELTQNHSNSSESEESSQLIRLIPVAESDTISKPTSLTEGVIIIHQQDTDLNEITEASQCQLQRMKPTPDFGGFDPALFFIKEYCIALCEHIRSNQRKRDQLKESTDSPLSYNPNEVLIKLRTYTKIETLHDSQLYYQDQNDIFFIARRRPNFSVSFETFNEFNKQYAALKYCNAPAMDGTIETELEGYFLQAIFDSLNQSLDHERPCSLHGKPLPWDSNSQQFKNRNQWTRLGRAQGQEPYDEIFGVAIARVIQWGTVLCGFLSDTADMENTDVDENYITSIRESRLALMLQKMLQEESLLFANHELEHAEVLLILAQQIARELLQEAANEIFCNSQVSI